MNKPAGSVLRVANVYLMYICALEGCRYRAKREGLSARQLVEFAAGLNRRYREVLQCVRLTMGNDELDAFISPWAVLNEACTHKFKQMQWYIEGWKLSAFDLGDIESPH